MIKGNVVDDRNLRLNNVGGIQPPTHTDFQNGPVYSPFCKKAESHSCGHLEKCGRFALIDYISHPKEDIGYSPVVHVLVVDSETFVEPYQVR